MKRLRYQTPETIMFPSWVLPPSECETMTQTLKIDTPHGIISYECRFHPDLWDMSIDQMMTHFKEVGLEKPPR